MRRQGESNETRTAQATAALALRAVQAAEAAIDIIADSSGTVDSSSAEGELLAQRILEKKRESAQQELEELKGAEKRIMACSSRASRPSGNLFVVGDSTRAAAPRGARHADLLRHTHPARELEVARLRLAGFLIRSVLADGWKEPSPA